MHWELVQDDTGPWQPLLGLQMTEGNFVLAAVLVVGLLLQSAAELENDILMRTEPVDGLERHSFDMFVAPAMDMWNLSVAVGDLVLGGFVQHVVAQLMPEYFVWLDSAAHLEVCS